MLDERLPQNYVDIKLMLWRRTILLKDFKGLSFFTTMHIYNNRLLICYSQKNELYGAYVNKETFQIEENFQFQGEQYDYTFVHSQTYFTRNCIWFISYNRASLKQIFYADLLTKTVFSIQNQTKIPFRINFSFTQKADLQFFIFGGFDDQMKLSNQLDLFDLVQCDFLPFATKGQIPSPRHSHMACLSNNKYIVAGGSTSVNLFERTYITDMHLLDLKTNTWCQLKNSLIPKGIGFGQYVMLNGNQLIYLAEENNSFNQYQLSLTDYQWTCMRSQKDMPPFKYKAAICLDPNQRQIFVFGGYNFQKNTLNCQSLERLQLILKDNKEPTIEGYNGQTINLIKLEKQQQINFQQQMQKQMTEEPKDIEQQEELTFEELLEQEKQLQKLDEMKQEQKKKNKKNKKKTKSKSKC